MTDEEIVLMHGASGLGVYTFLCNKLYENGGSIPVARAMSFKCMLRTTVDKISAVIHSCMYTTGDMLRCPSVDERISHEMSLRLVRRGAAEKRWKASEKTTVATPKTRSAAFVKPTVAEIREYMKSKGYNVFAEEFYDYYESNGWMIGKCHMKDWKATVRRWAVKDKSRSSTNKLSDIWND